MKKSIKSITLMLSLFAVIFSAQAQTPQETIDKALMTSFYKQSNQVEGIIKEQPNDYWKAYAYFKSSIYSVKLGDEDKARKEVEQALSIIKEAENQDSELLALEGNILGYSISLNPAKTQSLASKSTGKYKKSLKLNKQNMRAYLGLGENDFHTPEKYGGGKVAEKYLLKALEAPITTSEDVNAPNWGRERVYMLLVKLYERQGKSEKAVKYCKEGIAAFPNDYELKQLADKVL
ncbi:hypothetical protein KMW28_21315 [Flammeovirga yaeyamensis]|uniref:Tetratricopeptide repeat protein n=1 Tax=Flammeovirga yaeyamensis TaxID=367791 RepID=A0AAX1NBL0_9BACT|nr:tetratricopeptide repeat protein [Flammeovirga yaeyamensis]MBB3697107.1 tetratricopeptide (TPR) repeat protein [Flammeovirga yaeyamensis]NMF33770.1 tetratricopeptide repeat protein [Flammeovirga yaeyamensis]QWG04964.1 hypothetical protein KMW28_21315 [Flammeovirga yaeyamensis]